MGKSIGQKIWYWIYVIPLKITKFLLLLILWIIVIILLIKFFWPEKGNSSPSILTPAVLRAGVKISP